MNKDNDLIFEAYIAPRAKGNVDVVLREDHDETDMSNPEEKREVLIGKEILELCDKSKIGYSDKTQKGYTEYVEGIKKLAQELIDMHMAEKSEEDLSQATGGPTGGMDKLPGSAPKQNPTSGAEYTGPSTYET